MLVRFGANCKARITLALLWSAGLRADVLTLNDGTRYTGRVVEQSESRVVFEVVLEDGRSSSRRIFPAARVQAIERGPLPEPPKTAESAADKLPWTPRDARQVLDEACELLDAGDDPAALRALQRLVTKAGRSALAELDEACRVERHLPLDELLARTRLKLAQSQRTGQMFALTGVTPYETRALVGLLITRADQALQKVHAGKTVADWAQTPDQYNRLDPDAIELVRDARRAAAFVSGRLRVDDAFRVDSPERRRLRRLHDQLAQLIVHVTSLHGYTGLGAGADEDDPTIAAAGSLATHPTTTTSAPTSAPNTQEPQPGDPP